MSLLFSPVAAWTQTVCSVNPLRFIYPRSTPLRASVSRAQAFLRQDAKRTLQVVRRFTTTGKRDPRFVCRSEQGQEPSPLAGPSEPPAVDMDTFIQSLRHTPDLRAAVSMHANRFDRSFFLRLAEISDQLPEEERKELSALAERCMVILQDIWNAAEEGVKRSREVLRELLNSLEVDGALAVPISNRAATNLKNAVAARKDLDEGVIVLLMGWLQRAQKDGKEDMVVILQRVLQAIIAFSLAGSEEIDVRLGPPHRALNKVIRSDEQLWEGIIRSELLGEAPSCTKDELLSALHLRFEETVLKQANGSALQQAQAEYLQEVEKRVKDILGIEYADEYFR